MAMAFLQRIIFSKKQTLVYHIGASFFLYDGILFCFLGRFLFILRKMNWLLICSIE